MSVLKFNVGDVVRLNSGGPELLVQNVNGPTITVVWIQENGYGQLSAAPVCFRLVRRVDGDHDRKYDVSVEGRFSGHHIEADDVRVNPLVSK